MDGSEDEDGLRYAPGVKDAGVPCIGEFSLELGKLEF